MEAKELRMGNIVNDIHTGKCQIIGIFIDATITNKGYSSIEYIEPIPLTEEWLNRAGFTFIQLSSDKSYKKFAKPYLSKSIRVNCTKFGSCYFVCRGQTIYIKYVHQLQNLYFALTGQELEFEI